MWREKSHKKIKMERLKTFGIWILLIVAFYIFSQIITYLFLYDPAKDANSNSAEIQAVQETNNVPANRVEILN